MAQLRETALWLAVLGNKGLSRRAAKELLAAWCVREQRQLGELCALAAGDVAAALADLSISPELAGALAQALRDTAAAQATLARLAAAQIEVITRVDAAYPEDLAQRLPEAELPYLLFALGALDHLAEIGLAEIGLAEIGLAEIGLAETGIAVGGAHDADRLDAADLAQLAAGLASSPAPILGGYDRGADRELLLQVVEAGGRVTVLLPLGFDHAQTIIAQMRPALDAGRALLLSPFLPDQPYNERSAPARLRLLAALAGGLLLVEPDVPPDAWPGAAALLARGGVVTVLAREDSAAVRAWEAAGAVLADRPAAAIAALAAVWAGPAGGEAEGAADALPGVEPIYFQDADEAIAVLGQSGRVPPALARRLRESSLFGYQDVEDIDEDVDVDGVDEEPEKE